MKKKFLMLSMVALICSCGNDDKKDPAAEKKTEKTMSAEEDRGLTLITNNDCLGCHQVYDKMTGPPYADIARKHAGQPGIEDTLAQRIIKGSVGHWGTIPMTPHPSLSEDDAKAMVKYILSLNQ